VSERPISVGDLVMVVRGHECHKGEVYTVHGIEPATAIPWKCKRCKEVVKVGEYTFVDVTGRSEGFPDSWLRRIPPLTELEGERTEEKLKEPA